MSLECIEEGPGERQRIARHAIWPYLRARIIVTQHVNDPEPPIANDALKNIEIAVDEAIGTANEGPPYGKKRWRQSSRLVLQDS